MQQNKGPPQMQSKPNQKTEQGGVQDPKPAQVKAANQQKEHKVIPNSTNSEIDLRYRHLTCYNCGEPDHFVGICTKPKICFICATPGHYMTACKVWKRTPLVATYIGSAGKGLGFYHIDLPEVETTRWLNLTNCGVVKIVKGEISLVKLEKELLAIFCRNWPWQIRELTPCRFLVRFPPHKMVADIKSLPSFNLRKEGVQV
jgi:hypothetical protein